jgi:hypothetical protein
MCSNEIEGAEKLVSDGVGELGVGFSSDNVEVNAAAPENGNVRFTVTSKVGNGEWGTGNGEWGMGLDTKFSC